MALPVEQQVAQLTDELAQARAQLLRVSNEIAATRNQAAQAIADSEARTAALIARIGAEGGRGDEIKMLDLKVHKPDNFHGRRDEPWKVWSRQFKTYCNAIRTGFRKALEWSENFEGECIDESAIDSMGWPQARLADEKLYDFLVMICKGDALVIVETYDGLGFEAWRQLHKRYAPSGGRYELEMMSRIMNPSKVGRIQDLPGAILRFERDIRNYEARTGRRFPPEWKTPTFLKLLPDSHRDELERRYQMGMRD